MGKNQDLIDKITAQLEKEDIRAYDSNIVKRLPSSIKDRIVNKIKKAGDLAKDSTIMTYLRKESVVKDGPHGKKCPECGKNMKWVGDKKTPDRHKCLKCNKFVPESLTKEDIKKYGTDEEKKFLKEGVGETFPEKAYDFNSIPNKEQFWNLSIEDARKMARLSSPRDFKNIGDIIFWLNMVAMAFERSNNEENEIVDDMVRSYGFGG